MKNFLGVIVLSVLLTMEIQAQVLPEGFNTTFATNVLDANWVEPVGATFSTDGNRLFIWEKGGRVWVCNRNASDGLHIRQVQKVIDISDEVGNWSDHGLLGFALDPAFNSNGGYIYLYYVVDRHHLVKNGDPNVGYDPTQNDYESATIGRITRYNTHIVGGNLVADMSTRQILLGESKSTGIPILHKSHGVGSLAFALDGTLLATAGDGASYVNTDVGAWTNNAPEIQPPNGTYYVDALADGIIRTTEDVGAFRSQMLNSHSGKLLRLDPTNGNGVGSNPFFDPGNPRSAKSRTWALGLRNPFRMFIKPGAGSTNPTDGHLGEIFIGDVGFGTAEELNIVTKPGQNFGWPIYEGSQKSGIIGTTSYWGYPTLKNQEELRPMCDNRDVLFFHELLKQDNFDKNSDIFSDCSGELIRSGTSYIHARPALEWGHTPGTVFVPKFNPTTGEATWPTVGSPESGVNYSGDFDGNASTGGIWYKNTAGVFPPEYTNTFLVSDFGGRWVRRIGIDFSDVVTSINDFFINPAGSPDGAVVSMAENPIDGSIVYIAVGLVGDDHYGSNTTVSKITFGGKLPPIAKIVADNNFTAGNSLTVHFSADSSFDKDGTVTKYHWNFGDPDSGPDNESTLENPTHVFTTPLVEPKMYVVTLSVEDDDTLSSQEVDFIVSLNNIPPSVQITSPIDGDRYRVGGDTVYSLEANVTDDPDQVLTYAWQTSLIHTTNGRTHSHSNPFDNNEQTTAIIDRAGCSSADTYHWLITLKVTDDAGLSASDKAEIFPECASTLPLTLRSFSVTQQGNVNLLKWTTEFEANIEYFEVERSYDGINFSSINRQDARNTNAISHYSYPDNNFEPGVVYYRLKIVEQGNNIRYSVTVKTVSATENLGLKIVPNPVSGNFSVVYKSLADDNVTIKVTDLTGRVLHTLKENVNRGLNVIYLQNLPNWPAGVYFLSVQNKDEVKREKFVKTR